uniref:Uncharacterized protein n=1 Tax=Meloidogyne enterolobii TaxID=390850 RepID=A0A6V7WI56_MELEN|nr:unnamed protein product [Meloidogyne enterolobii]
MPLGLQIIFPTKLLFFLMFLFSLASAALIIPLLINSRKSEQVNRGGNSSIFGSQINQKQKFSCPKNCFCAHSTVICKGLGLDPKQYLVILLNYLQGNRITKLYFDDLLVYEMTCAHWDNLIQEIENNVFDNLQALERLRLDKIVYVHCLLLDCLNLINY